MSETKRRTVSIKGLIEQVNAQNRLSTCHPQVREGWNSLLESVLHAGNVYKGFSYLSRSDVPEGHPAGIVKEGEGYVFPDETRRFYFIARSLTGEKVRKIGPNVYTTLPRDPMGAHGTLPSGEVL